MLRILEHRRLIAGGIVLLGLVLAAFWPRPLEVDLAHAAKGPLTVTVDEEGETRVRDRFVVSAPVAGELLRIELEPGDVVHQGDRLAGIRPAAPPPLDARARVEALAGVRAAEAVLNRARAERDQAAATQARARRQVELAERLLAAGAVARDELDARETVARVSDESRRAADFAVAQADHGLQAARARLIDRGRQDVGRDIWLTSPVAGVVLKRYRESETVVPAGEALIEVGDQGRLEIVSDFLSSDAVKVRAGQPVLIEQWGGGRTLKGRVRRVEPSGFLKVSALGVEEQRVNVIIDFEDAAEAWRALGDAYRVEVRVVVWQADATVQVPIGSLFRRGDQWAVFVVQDGRARLRTITVGQRNGVAAQVLEGLAEHERVVLYPPDTLRNGLRVTERGA